MTQKTFYFIEITKESLNTETKRTQNNIKKCFYRHAISASVMSILLIIYQDALMTDSIITRALFCFAILLLFDNMFMSFRDLYDLKKASVTLIPEQVKSTISNDMARNSHTAVEVLNGMAILKNEDLTQEDIENALAFLENVETLYGNKPTLTYIQACIHNDISRNKGYLLTELLRYALENDQLNLLEKGSSMAENILITEVIS